jgi:hypothetical protein
MQGARRAGAGVSMDVRENSEQRATPQTATAVVSQPPAKGK